jgi:hypothetical protein
MEIVSYCSTVAPQIISTRHTETKVEYETLGDRKSLSQVLSSAEVCVQEQVKWTAFSLGCTTVTSCSLWVLGWCPAPPLSPPYFFTLGSFCIHPRSPHCSFSLLLWFLGALALPHPKQATPPHSVSPMYHSGNSPRFFGFLPRFRAALAPLFLWETCICQENIAYSRKRASRYASSTL